MIKTKKILLSIICSIAFLLSVFSPIMNTYADEEGKSKDKGKIVSGANDYSDGEGTVGLIDKYNNEDIEGTKTNRNKFSYVLSRVILPGYLNNTSTGTLSNKLKNPRDSKGYTCKPNEPQNVLNGNCDIPNFAAELLQMFTSEIYETGIIGGEQTQSKATFGFGEPKNIPGGVVPVNPNSRSNKYTALELYGYNLKWTSYKGEWDRINTSTAARMLSNFGTMDSFRAGASAIHNGVTSAMGSLVEGFSFNPLRWAYNVFEAASSGSLNAIIDTSDLNVIATNGWSRVAFNDTLYNVYVLSDKEVANESAKVYIRFFVNQMHKIADGDPHLKSVMDLESPPLFTYDPDRMTDESIAERERIDELNKENLKKHEESKIKNEEDENEEIFEYEEIPLPDLIHMTEEEQYDEYKVDNKAFLDKGAEVGIFDDSVTYPEMTKIWSEKWEPYMKTEFGFKNDPFKEITENIDEDFFANNPHLDPKQPISHYVCADANGSPLTDSSGNYEYLYLDKNTSDSESLNTKCSPIRPTVRGGFFGSGWHVDVEPDSRNAIFNQNRELFGFGQFRKSIGGAFMKINSFISILSNELLNLSFTPLMTELGVTDIIETIIVSFRDTIFFPLSTLAAMMGAIMLLVEVLKSRNIMGFFISVLTATIIFVIGTMLLLNPDKVISFVDEVPYKLDNAIADLMLSENGANGMCKTDGKGINNGIRSAQCSLWETTVFTPWVFGQFGTSYSNLYANGKAPEGGASFENKNGSLVGDAGVYMGGGHTENNWALYHLDKTKTGTITTHQNGSNYPDPNLYRLVDLQAGPNNGALSDARYIGSWSGHSDARLGTGMLSVVVSIVVALSIIGIAFKKIEYSFIFGISIIALPVMLLRGFTTKGQFALKKYIEQLVNLLIKRVVATVILVSVLRLFSSVTNVASDNYLSLAFTIIALSLAFKIYSKEIFSLFDGDGVGSMQANKVKDLVNQTVPLGVKNSYYRAKARTSGTISGALGGTLAGLTRKVPTQVTGEDGESSIELIRPSITQRLSNAHDGFHRGAVRGADTLGQRQENKIRTGGFSAGEVRRNVKDSVTKTGAEEIIKGKDATASDVFRDMSKHTQYGKQYSDNENFNKLDEKVIKDSKTQAQLRKEAQKRKKLLEVNRHNEGKPLEDIKITKEDITTAVDKLDQSRERVALSEAIRNPIETGHDVVNYVKGGSKVKGEAREQLSKQERTSVKAKSAKEIEAGMRMNVNPLNKEAKEKEVKKDVNPLQKGETSKANNPLQKDIKITPNVNVKRTNDNKERTVNRTKHKVKKNNKGGNE